MLVIANGESRKGLRIDDLPGVKIGCNAIFRHHKVRHIVAPDKRIVKEIVSKYVNLKSGIWTRPDWKEDFGGYHNINALPGIWYTGDKKADEAFHWGAGPYAVYLATVLSKKEPINLVGFDLYGNDSKINNIFKGTDNYEPADSKAVDPRFWIYQIAKVFEHNSTREFRVFNRKDWTMPEEWNLPNVKFCELTTIKEML